MEEEAFDFGSTSKVFKCRSIKSGEIFACKQIDKRRIFTFQRHRGNPGVRMMSEIENCSKLHHPNLMDIVDVFETQAYVFVVTEFMWASLRPIVVAGLLFISICAQHVFV